MFKSVMIVEDDEAIRVALKHIIESQGFTVWIAENGKEAVTKLRALASDSRPCLVLVDFMMPLMNGAEMIEVLQKDECLASIPVIMMTASSKPPDVPVKIIRKPYGLDEIFAALQKHC